LTKIERLEESAGYKVCIWSGLRGSSGMEDRRPKSRPKMTFDVVAKRIDAHGSEARCKSAVIALNTDLGGSADAFNPAELLLAALSA
jgi:organic hydroperoxide reductase OsmC/OhrA